MVTCPYCGSENFEEKRAIIGVFRWAVCLNPDCQQSFAIEDEPETQTHFGPTDRKENHDFWKENPITT